MLRRDFTKNTLAAGAVAALAPHALLAKGKQPFINAYYFRAHSYTLVPKHVREDMQRMADMGTNAVTVAILEQDLYAAVENFAIIRNEAAKAGMVLYAVPSRWGGLVAGAPKVPSYFSVTHPETWMLDASGKPVHSSVSGVISSVHHPATLEFVCTSLEKLLKTWEVSGIIWDEPKCIITDYSPAAINALGVNAPWEAHLAAIADFFSKVNEHAKKIKPEADTCLFLYAHVSDLIMQAFAIQPHIDTFGCDGRPWGPNDGGENESKGKVLLEAGERFLKIAAKYNKKSLWLIENHNMKDEDAWLMDKRFPEILAKKPDHLIYYYYPRNIQSPDLNMKIIRNHLKSLR